MLSSFTFVIRRPMSTNPTSHFITLPNRPVVQANGETTLDNLKLHYWQWQGQQPTVLFCHAASFHARCYDRIINDALRGRHVIALDFRGHGRSQQHPPPYRFRWIGEDVLQLIETMNLTDGRLLGIGHSIGGYALTCAAAIASKRLFQSLLLIDPVIVPQPLYAESDDDDDGEQFNTDFILRRKAHWSSVEEMVSRLGQRSTFSQWPKDVLRDYCTYALDEQHRLVCNPAGEASIYRSSVQRDANLYPLIERSRYIHDIPIHVVRVSPSDSAAPLDQSPTAPDLATRFRKGRDTLLETTKHLFPMEQPEIASKLVTDFLETNQKLPSHL